MQRAQQILSAAVLSLYYICSILGTIVTPTKTPKGRQLKRPQPLTPLTAYVDRLGRDKHLGVHAALANMLYLAGVPFSLVKHLKFKYLLSRLQLGYKPPTRKTMSTKYLDKRFDELKAKFDLKLKKARDTGEPLRFTLVTDGWTNTRNKSIVNYVLVEPTGQAYFHSSDATGDFLSSELKRVIKDIGEAHINAICTDTASNMLAAVSKVRETYPKIYGIK